MDSVWQLLLHTFSKFVPDLRIISLFSFVAYILSDLGYDVWMGNARGNIYSKYHKRYRANGTRHERKIFWNFSWHELGV